MTPKVYHKGKCTSPYSSTGDLYQIHIGLKSNHTKDLCTNSSRDLLSCSPSFRAISQHIDSLGIERLCNMDIYAINNNSLQNEELEWPWIVRFFTRANDTSVFVENILAIQNTSFTSGNVEYILHFEKDLNVLWTHYTKIDSLFSRCVPRETFSFSRLLVCPYVYVNRNRIIQVGKYRICIQEDPSVCFSYLDYDEKFDFVIICADKYFNTGSSKAPESHQDKIESILSFVCTILSIISLCFTLLTFFCFSSLRTLPGLNTMGLSTSLILAHALYSFGLNKVDHGALCIVLGILIHFQWLNSVLWMNVCCVHMFRVFGLTNFHSLKKRRSFSLYILYTIIASAIVVSMHIVVRYFTSADIGYGGRICYINDYKMVLYFFAIPVALVVTTNVALFVCVVVKLARLPNMSEAVGKQRDYMTIYAKLTTLTGITWIVGFIYQHILVKELSYVYIVLNGCQGVYIMIAFSLNKRVRNLYIEKFKFKPLKTRSDDTHTKETYTHSNHTREHKSNPDDKELLEENTYM